MGTGGWPWDIMVVGGMCAGADIRGTLVNALCPPVDPIWGDVLWISLELAMAKKSITLAVVFSFGWAGGFSPWELTPSITLLVGWSFWLRSLSRFFPESFVGTSSFSADFSFPSAVLNSWVKSPDLPTDFFLLAAFFSTPLTSSSILFPTLSHSTWWDTSWILL